MKKNELKCRLKLIRFDLFLPFLFFPIFSSGCISFDHSSYSAPKVFDLDRKIEEGGVLFEWAELDLAVSPWPYRTDHLSLLSPYPLPPFIPVSQKSLPSGAPVLWFRFDFIPKNNQFSIDPMRVIFLDSDGKKLLPSGYIGPKRMTDRDGSSCRREEATRKTEGPIPIQGPACLLLQFETSPSVERSFSLRIQGIKKKDRLFPVPEITFQEGSSWMMSSVP